MRFNKFNFYNHRLTLGRILLVVIVTVITVCFFPKSDRFKYEFNKFEPWPFETLYAPFDFTILKSQETIDQEIALIKEQTPLYFDLDNSLISKVKQIIRADYKVQHKDTIPENLIDHELMVIDTLLHQIYKTGYTEQPFTFDANQLIVVNIDNQLEHQTIDDINTPKDLNSIIDQTITKFNLVNSDWIKRAVITNVVPNISYNKQLTDQVVNDQVNDVLPTRGMIKNGARIIAQGEIVEGENYQILTSLNQSYQSNTWTKSRYIWKFIAYLILVSIVNVLLLMFLKIYRPSIYINNRKLLFIYFNSLSIIILTSVIINIDSRLVYAIPVCLLPLILKAFFDARTGLFTHIMTLLILSFMIPFGKEYLFLQTVAGIIVILSNSQIYKRANLFITIGQIVIMYILCYVAFYFIKTGGLVGWDWSTLGYFVFCGIGMLFVWPIIYIYERVFGLVSDVSLLELSDTNSTLLKQLSNKAPGTFHHSLNVANIAETLAQAVNANAMLVRVGALYHDIGKMSNPTYFIENQISGVNPHDDLDALESATIIINHVTKGIEIAKKNKLPDRVIDFIRSHHGDTTVYYFYKKAQENNINIDSKLFKYPGPKPFSLETAILMIADSVEAASKSIKNPDTRSIYNLVDRVIDKQIAQNQFVNADITFKQIETIKVVLKKKLANIYHLRIEYPE